MADGRPLIVAIAGPNGAGKSTCAPALVGEVFGLDELINADVSAEGLSALHPTRSP